MFGYVKPYVPELRIIENKYYGAAYCGLCRTMRRETGMLSRLTLSYDLTFLALARLAVTGEIPQFEEKRCFVHPLKKKLVMKPCEALAYSAKVCVILSMRKLDDTIKDESLPKRLGARILKLLFAKAYGRAKKGCERIDEICAESLSKLYEIERERLRSADTPAGVFGEMMGGIFAYGCGEAGNEKRRIAENVGFYVGKWIYLVDALDDIEDDAEKGNYNPFILLFDGKDLDEEKKTDIKCALEALTLKARNAFDLVDFEGRRDLCGLIDNILTEGMTRMTEAVLCKDEYTAKRKKRRNREQRTEI